MKTNTPPQKKSLAAAVAGATHAWQFAGFDDWFEVFTTGEQTDSKGRTQTFTEADLDSIVANHNAADPAPLVVGHPKTNHPAYGWTADLKREGNKLFAKATDVVSEFEDAVKAKMYRKRSVSIEPDGSGGFALRHIGWLGAKPPAVKGLADLAFAANDETTLFEFSVDDAVREAGWGLESIGRALRSIRDWIISEHDLDTANLVLPDYQVNSVQQSANSLHEQLREKSHSFSSDDNDNHPHKDGDQEDEMTFTQADLDKAAADAAAAADQRAKEAEKQLREMKFSATSAEAQALIDGLVNEGKLLPAQTEGLAEFMTQLSALESTFEFSSGDDTVEKSPYEFATGLLKGLGKQIALGKDEREGDDTPTHNYSAPDGYTVSDERLALHSKAQDYAAKHNVSYEVAVKAVEKA